MLIKPDSLLFAYVVNIDKNGKSVNHIIEKPSVLSNDKANHFDFIILFTKKKII